MKKKYVWFEDLDGIVCCPGCGHQVDNYAEKILGEFEFIEPKFCPNCGQALDWSETRSYGVREEHETE